MATVALLIQGNGKCLLLRPIDDFDAGNTWRKDSSMMIRASYLACTASHTILGIEYHLVIFLLDFLDYS
jgi:hypothetical protein